MFFQHLKHGSINHQTEVLYINQPSKRDKSTATWIQAKLCISNSNNLSKQKRRLHGHVFYFFSVILICFFLILQQLGPTMQQPHPYQQQSLYLNCHCPLLHPWPETNMIIYIIENEATSMQRKMIRRKLFLIFANLSSTQLLVHGNENSMNEQLEF